MFTVDTYDTTSIPSASPDRPFIPVYAWQTAEHPKAIIHIVHGMSEFGGRYKKVAESFLQQNYLVIAHDHIGHGGTAKEANRLGYFGTNRADEIMVEDLHRVVTATRKKHPNLPYYVLGHSMGAYITRLYLGKHSHEIDGVLLSGTNTNSPLYATGAALAPILNTIHPQAYNYYIHQKLFGTGLSDDPLVSKSFPAYWYPPKDGQVQDWPLVGFVFTNNGFAELVKIAHKATVPSWLNNIRRDLPIAIIAGRKDPLIVGGKETQKLAKQFTRAKFKDVSILMFENRGHECMLYGNTKPVYALINKWLTKQMKTSMQNIIDK